MPLVGASGSGAAGCVGSKIDTFCKAFQLLMIGMSKPSHLQDQLSMQLHIKILFFSNQVYTYIYIYIH